MLCSNFGVDTARAFRNSVAYLQSWADNLKGDPKAVVIAAGRAEKAARYILGERESVEPAKA
jgi:antirestriction protein ArdC